MGLQDYCFDGKRELDLKELPTGAWDEGLTKKDKERCIAATEKNLAHIAVLQDKLYAAGKEGVVVVLQAMDAAGKDSTIKHVMRGVNPQGVDVVSFKQPSSEELRHDYLWRAHRALPERGKIAIFNRSYYEDVLVVRVHRMQKDYAMASRCLDMPDKEFFEKRYAQIRHFEEYLYENSYRVVKIFLNVSRQKQKQRFLERIDIPEKNWKFSQSDLKERAHWDEYMHAYEKAVNETAAGHSPWYVVPADQKWYARYLISQVVRQVLEEADPEYPELPKERQRDLAECKKLLETER